MEMLLAIFFIKVVLPAFGGDTIKPLCPFPIGDTRSIIRVARSFLCFLFSKVILWLGKIGVKSSKGRRRGAFSGSSPLTAVTYNRALNLSPSFVCLVLPDTISPVLRLNRRI